MTNEVYTDMEAIKPDNKAVLYNYLFHYNHLTGLWSAIHRDSYLNYWSNYETTGVLRSKSMQTLMDILQRTNGDPALIDQLTREQ